MTRSPLAVFLWLGLIPSICDLCGAQVAAESPIYTERLEVRLIHLDVLVTDGGGTAVTDLTREDFEVRADGEPVDISLFAPPDSTTKDREGSVDVEEAEIAPAIRTGEWILYFDDENLLGANRERVIRNLGPAFEAWPQGAAIRLLYRRGLDSVQLGPFDSPNAVLEALRQRPKALSRAVFSNRARERALRNLADIREACVASGRSICVDCWNEQLSEATSHAVDGAQRVQRTVAGLANLVASRDPNSGPSTLVYVGDGLPQIPGASVFSSLGDLCPDRATEAENEALAFDQGRLLDQLGALANAQRVAFHLIDAGGLRPSASRNDSDYIRGQQDGLLSLARSTGGTAILNANKPGRPMQTAVAREQVRYTLGFTLDEPPSGRVYRLEVSLTNKRRGRSLSYRRSFYDQRPEDRLLRRLTSLLDPSVGGDLDTGITMGILESKRIDRRLRKLELRIRIPEDRIVLLPGPRGVRSGSLGLGLASVDEKGNIEPARYRSIAIGGGGVEPVSGSIELVIGMSIAHGERTFAVAIRDETTGQDRFARFSAEVP